MLVLDAFFRFSAIGLMLFSSTIAIRDLKRTPSYIYFLLLLTSIISHFFGFTPQALELPYYLRMIFRFLDIPFLVFIWLFSLSLFKSNFKFTKFHFLIGISYSFFILAERLVQFRFITGLPVWWAWVVNLSSLAFIIHLLFVVIGGRNDDLIEKRRKSRVHLVYITSLISIILVSISFFLLNHSEYSYLQPTTTILAIWPIIVWMNYWLLSMKENSFSFDTPHSKKQHTLNSQDTALQKTLNTEIKKNKAYLENGISIQTLAKRLGVSSYRLREFINQILGHDNFSTYINGFRIESIKQEFLNPDKAHIPIITIALKNGFNSLSTFNRAFKSTEGKTPSEYRKTLRD